MRIVALVLTLATAMPPPQGTGLPEDPVSPAPPPAAPSEPALEPPEALRLEQIEGAKQAFTDGERHFERAEYIAAARQFERSYGLIPSGPSLYNIALSYEKAQRPVQALAAAQRYLALPDCDRAQQALVCATKHREVRDTAARLRAQVAELVLWIPEGVIVREIRVDGEPYSPELFPVLVEPGWVELEFVGLEPGALHQTRLRLEAGTTQKVEVDPFILRMPPPPQAVPPPDDPLDGRDRERPSLDAEGRDPLRAAFWALLGSTGAAAVSVAVVGGLTLDAKRDFEAGLCGSDCEFVSDDPTMARDGYPFAEETRFRRLRAGTNVMIGITAALGAVTAVLAGLTFSRAPSTRSSRFGPRGITFGPRLTRLR